MDDGSAALDVLCRGQLPLRAAAAATVIAGVDACYLPPGRYDTKRLNHFELQFRVGDVVRLTGRVHERASREDLVLHAVAIGAYAKCAHV